MLIVGIIAGTNGFTANIYTIENYKMYQYLIIKPYTKLHLFGIGFLFSILYFDILEYRKLDTF